MSAVAKTILSTIIWSSIALAQMRIPPGHSQPKPPERPHKFRVYVWDFRTNLAGDDKVRAALLADEVETFLVQSGRYDILERRNFAALLKQRDDEVSLISQLSVSDRQVLQNQMRADGVVFGDVYDDTRGGEVVVTISLQGFDSTKPWQSRKSMKRSGLFDQATRAQFIRSLLASTDAQPGNSSSSGNDGSAFVGGPHDTSDLSAQMVSARLGLLKRSPIQERAVGRMQDSAGALDLSAYHCEAQEISLVCVFGLTNHGQPRDFDGNVWNANKLVDAYDDEHAYERGFFLTRRGEQRKTINLGTDDTGFLVQEFRGVNIDIKEVRVVNTYLRQDIRKVPVY